LKSDFMRTQRHDTEIGNRDVVGCLIVAGERHYWIYRITSR
jgi:hypothetical protein